MFSVRYINCQYFTESIKIGEQIWMAENLNVDHFRNGDIIQEARSRKQWDLALSKGEPAWCYYNNEFKNGKKYGKLYNWYAIIDPRGLAPEGWHVSSKDEWDILEDYLGDDVCATKIKSTSSWIGSVDGTNESGFTALPGGMRSNNGDTDFYFEGFETDYWTTSEPDIERVWCIQIPSSNDIRAYCSQKNKGCYVRCVLNNPEKISDIFVIKKNSEYIVNLDTSIYEWEKSLNYGSVSDIDKNQYKTVVIGNQEWMAENLRVTHYSNGDSINFKKSENKNESIYKNLTTGVYDWYQDTLFNHIEYGALYNFYVVDDSRNVCPLGWHVPSINDWKILLRFLSESGYSDNEGAYLKAYGWRKNQESIYGLDYFGFRGIPGGYQHKDGFFSNIGVNSYYWSSDGLGSNTFGSQKDKGFAYCLSSSSNSLHRELYNKSSKLSIRCIKD